MNKAVRTLFPDMKFYESDNGIPVMECDTLPEGARRIEEPEILFAAVDDHCRRPIEIGLYEADYSKALPVFIRSMELNGNATRFFYRVNYVSPSKASKQRAADYIADGKLYAVIP